MDRSVIGLFNSLNEAHQVVTKLTQAGFDRQNISLVANDVANEYSPYLSQTSTQEDAVKAPEGASFGAVVGGLTGVLASLGALAIPGVGPVIAAGPLLAALGGGAVGAVAGAATGGLTAALVKTGLSDEDAQYYSEGVRRGGTLVIVDTTKDMAEQAADIMDSNGAVDVHEQADTWKQNGWTGFDANAKPYTRDELNKFRSSYAAPQQNSQRTEQTSTEGKTVLPVVEEELQVGKRQVERGGVRVNTRVVERPVQEQINLHEEHVNVERRPVNRAVDPADIKAFKEGTFEVTERAEEAIVAKHARVIEEVVIEKHSHERAETINDTVRKTEVNVEQLNNQQSATASDFDRYAKDFQSHYQSHYGNDGYSYDQYTPAYRYGYTLAGDSRYSGDWSTVEPEARRQWEERNKGTWEEFKDAIRYAWDKVRGVRPASSAR